MEKVHSANEVSGQTADAQADQSLELAHIKIVDNTFHWLKHTCNIVGTPGYSLFANAYTCSDIITILG